MNKFLGILMLIFSFSCQSKEKGVVYSKIKESNTMNLQKDTEIAIFAGGCFWCTEAVFLELKGVKHVASGYIGGTIENPTYEMICTGTTGHAEAILIEFDPKIVSFETLLELFFATHDPTTLNRQGNDVGTQYRSEIFYQNTTQKDLAEAYIAQMTQAKTFTQPIVTKVTATSKFYEAEDYHQNYYNQNKSQGYCHYVITPKIEKVRKSFKDKLKE